MHSVSSVHCALKSSAKPKLRELKIFDLIILSRDWHPSDHISFCKNHPGRELFSTIQIQTFDPNENPTKYSQTLWAGIEMLSDLNSWVTRTEISRILDQNFWFLARFCILIWARTLRTKYNWCRIPSWSYSQKFSYGFSLMISTTSFHFEDFMSKGENQENKPNERLRNF